MYNKFMKNKILQILNQNIDTYISGEEISKMLSISRAAVWKNIKKLKEEGYEILSTTNKGYCLCDTNDILSLSEIQKELSSFYKKIDIVDSIDSTNEELKRNASILEEGYVLISNRQEKGKGRNNRIFHSPKQEGIYMSILLRPKLSITHSLKLTACASVAIYESIKNLYQLSPKIKWVNDVYLHDKKIAGILCEASIEVNTANVEYMIVGIGINVHDYEMPTDLKEIATCIETYSDQKHSRNEIIKEVLNTFDKYYTEIDANTFLPIYKENSSVLFQDILVYEKDFSYSAHVLDIDENANLIIQKEDKTIEVLNAKEISIRKK